MSPTKGLFPNKKTGVEPKGINPEDVRTSPALLALNRPSAPKEYPWEKTKKNKKLPRVVSVTCTLTASEFTKLATEASEFKVSLSELGRERLLSAVPLEEWGISAAKALAKRDQDMNRIRMERNAARRQRRSLLRALAEGVPEDELPKVDETTPKKEKRVAQLQVRLTAYESVKVRWTAYVLKMSLASFMRKMVLGYLPGGEDDTTIPWESTVGTRNTRTAMLKAVIEVANSGRIPASSSLFYCKSCAQVLNPGDKH